MSEEVTNVLLIVADQHRGDWLGLYDELPVKTPNIDMLAEEGIAFSRACTPSPLCAPARACLAGGKWSNKTGVPNNEYDFPVDQLTFYKILRDAGYRVGSVGKNDLHKNTFYNGIEGWTSRMGKLGFTETVDSAGKWNTLNSVFSSDKEEAKKIMKEVLDSYSRDKEIDINKLSPRDPYMAYLFKWGYARMHLQDYLERKLADHPTFHPTPLPREFYADDFVGRESIKMLGNFPRREPWFLEVNFSGPHGPMDAPRELLENWKEVNFPQPQGKGVERINLSPEEHQKLRRNYAAQIEGIDQWVGKIVDEVKRRGELENTLIIYTADHGEMLGDHGLKGKTVFYEPSIRIPMVLSGKGVGVKSCLSNALVELLDLAPTILELANLEVPEDWDARSMANLLQGKNSEDFRAAQISMLDDKYMVYDGQWKLVKREQETALYNLQDDPVEDKDLSASHPEIVESLKRIYAAETAE